MQFDGREPQERKDRRAVKEDELLQQLQSLRPEQIENYIDNNVNDLNSAKTVLKVLAKTVALLARQL